MIFASRGIGLNNAILTAEFVVGLGYLFGNSVIAGVQDLPRARYRV